MDAAEIDKELEALEHKAEHLRALYEQYFMGIDRVEPLIHRRDVERRIVVLRREQLRNTAQRFKFNTLVQRFNTMSQHWARVVREIENGTYRRDVIRAAARFGDSALGVLGKKKTKDLLAAVARAKDKAPADEALELGADDLIEEEEEARPAPQAPPPAPSPGLGQGDLPVISALSPPASPAPAPRSPAAASPLIPVAKPPAQPAAAPQKPAGLRWGAPAPAAGGSPARPPADDAKRRVAEIAAQLAPQRQAQPKGGFGELNLDLEESPAAPPAASVTMPKPPAPAVTMGKPPAQPVLPTVPKPAQPLPAAASPARPAPAPAAPAPAPPAIPAFGELDIPLDEPLPPRPEPSPSPAAAIRSAAQLRPAPKPASAAAPVRPAGGEGELSDQRIRQIYSKYVEAKRSTQESTAGVTFEKLAESLRAQANKLKSSHPNRAVDYEVVVKDGKTHLKPVLR
jgi:hypothetical protein